MTGASSDADDALVTIAEVVKAVGLRGEVKLYPLMDFHPALLESAYLRWGDGELVELERTRSVRGGWAVQPAGCVDRDTAEALVGRELGFRREDYLAADFPRPPGGLPFRYLQRTVVTTDGEAIGEVVEVRRYGGPDVLVVESSGGEILIPAVEPILRPDDGLEGPLVVEPPEGLLDANA